VEKVAYLLSDAVELDGATGDGLLGLKDPGL